MKVLVTDGCGYNGTVLVPKLLAESHYATLVDAVSLGNFLEPPFLRKRR